MIMMAGEKGYNVVINYLINHWTLIRKWDIEYAIIIMSVQKGFISSSLPLGEFH